MKIIKVKPNLKNRIKNYFASRDIDKILRIKKEKNMLRKIKLLWKRAMRYYEIKLKEFKEELCIF